MKVTRLVEKLSILLVYMFFVIIPTCRLEKCTKDICDEDEKIQHEKEKYRIQNKDKWHKYLLLIDQALEEYKDCSRDDCYLLRRRQDFRLWRDRGGITQEDFQRAVNGRNGEHYQIINHRLYRQEKTIFSQRCKGNEHFLLKAVKQLPDMEMIINTYDWPKVDLRREPFPIFSFSTTPNNGDIMYPAWTFWQAGPSISFHPTGLGRWDLMREDLIKAAEKIPWEEKSDVAFFRGSRTSEERDPLILLSREKPSLIDAQYTKNQAYKSIKDTLNREPAQEVSLIDHCKYKYLFNFRGIAASFRMKHLFLCNSLVFHVGEEWKEFFYDQLKPWVHYIPVSTSLKEVVELLEFAHENQDVVKDIAQRGYDFIHDHLRMEDVERYWYKVLKRYAQLARWTPIRNETLKEIV